MFSRPSRDRRITGWQKCEVVEVSTRKACRTFVFYQDNPGVAPELRTAFVALRLATGDEYFEFVP